MDKLFKTNRDLYILPLCVALNILLVMVMFTLCRGIYLEDNIRLFDNISSEEMANMFRYGLIFDISAVLYTNLLYIGLALLPFPWKESRSYQTLLKWTYFIPNSVAILANLADAVYFPFTNRRTTASIFKEFKSEDNIGEIVTTEMVNHWYLCLILAAMLLCLWIFYFRPSSKIWRTDRISGWRSIPIGTGRYCLIHFIILAAVAYPIVAGLRGGFDRQTRPITISNANQYVKSPREAAIVLNTPFSVYRTTGMEQFPMPDYFDESRRSEMESIFTPYHRPDSVKEMKPLNVVIFIMESFSREYSGFLNRDIPGYDGYMPFLDSLMQESLTYKYSFANGHRSIDGMPSILSGIPMFIEPFFLTPYSMNDVTSVGGELAKQGWYTAFFHGARNGSMGFEAFARASGFKDYFGRTEYGQWLGHDDSADFDGFWGIWDEPFLQFYADKMNTFKEPFCTGIFTASSHHPFRVPSQYEGVFPEGEQPIHKCIGYSDNALRRFFETASKSEWFDHTLFVITGDHTNQATLPEYTTDAGRYGVPVIFYYPGGNKSGIDTLRGFDTERVAQQADIMPTVLDFLGYGSPYIAFGCDLRTTPPEKTFAVNYDNGFYQLFMGDYLLQSDGETSPALYRFRTDALLQDNLVNQLPDVREDMEAELRAIIQQYMERMNRNQLIVK